jgi:hypothetical protein
MDSINNISAELKHPLVFSNGNLEPIVINNPIVEYRWKTVFVTGVIGFVTFENIIDNEVFNFDIDFVRSLPDGSMMHVGKPIEIKIALEHSIVYKHFESNMGRYAYEETLQRLLSNIDSDFLLPYNWMVLTMYQKQKGKKIGHETIWNLINYDDPKLIENWDDLVGNASLQFVQHQGSMDDFGREQSKKEKPKDDFQQLFNQAKEQLMDKDNPLGKALSEMIGNEDAMRESLEKMMGMFDNRNDDFDDDFDKDFDDDVEEDEDFEDINGIIEEHLEMLHIHYLKDNENDNAYFFLHQTERTHKQYECKILIDEEYITTTSTYDRHISESKWPAVFRLLNSLNNIIIFGKLVLLEERNIIELRTELPSPMITLPQEPIVDMLDENWVITSEAFYILDYFLDGKLTLEQAIEEANDSFL